MKEKIEDLLEKNLQYLELNLRNGDSFSINEPNKDVNMVSLLDNDIVFWKQTHADGCVYENYFRISEISFVVGVYDCPQVLEDTSIDDEMEEDENV